jgi:peptidoglycan/LPS O-acetylase OafA/YrhL
MAKSAVSSVLREVPVSHSIPVVANTGPADRKSKTRLHLKYVDGLRALAALYVVLGHAWLQTWPHFTADRRSSGFTQWLTGWLNYGIFAVVFFIAISGFCLMLPVLANEGTFGPNGTRGFFRRRARRILPPYYMALLLSILLNAFRVQALTQSAFAVSLPMTKAGIISHFFLVHNLNPATSNQINLPLWSIAVECQIYLLFPLLVAVRRRFGMATVLGATYLASTTLQSLVEHTSWWGLKPELLFVFALGMYAAEVAHGPKRALFIWIGSAAAVAMVFLFQSEWLTKLGLTEFVVGVLAMSILVVCAHWPKNPIARLVSMNLIAKIGVFSYSLYLVHFPLQQMIWSYLVLPLHLGRTASFVVMAAGGTGLIVALAFAFYLIFERPFCNSQKPAQLSTLVILQPEI